MSSGCAASRSRPLENTSSPDADPQRDARSQNMAAGVAFYWTGLNKPRWRQKQFYRFYARLPAQRMGKRAWKKTGSSALPQASLPQTTPLALFSKEC